MTNVSLEIRNLISYFLIVCGKWNIYVECRVTVLGDFDDV